MNHEETILAALAYNSDDDEALSSEDQEKIRRGESVILTSTGDLGKSWVEVLWVVPAVRLVNGKYAYAADPVVLEYRLKRGQTAATMVSWWARRNFGKELPQVSIKR